VQIIWADVHDPTGRMAAMFQAVEAALEPLGFPPERRDFHPHATLGRVKFARSVADLRAAARRHDRTDFGTQRAEAITVYSSQLTPQGSIYTAIARGRFRLA